MEKQTGRLEAFSDGIFGVAITLLAIEIGIKEYESPTNLSLWHKILDDWPDYFTYFNSFAMVFLIWTGHHKTFKMLRDANHWVVLANGLVLMLIVLFPFPTRTVGNFIGTEAENTAVAFYTGFSGLISLSMSLLTVIILRYKFLILNPEKNIPAYQSLLKGQLLGLACYALMTVIALYASRVALGLSFAMWVYWAVTVQESQEDLESLKSQVND